MIDFDKFPPSISWALKEQSTLRPNKVFLAFRDSELTYLEVETASSRLAAGLHEVGERQGDILPCLLTNRAEAVVTWFACSHLGLVWAPINTEFRGSGLAHALSLTDSDTLLLEDALLPAFLEVAQDVPAIRRLILLGTSTQSIPPNFEVFSFDELASESLVARVTPSPADTCLLLYTSGTTGVSKACELSHRYVIGQSILFTEHFDLTEADVCYCPFPLFHWDATVGTVSTALLAGAGAAIAPRFSVSAFWQDIRQFGATIFDFMGATISLLHKQPPQPSDIDNSLRLGWGVPMPDCRMEFEQRFGLRLLEGYGSTEAGICVFQDPKERYPPGSCGRAVHAYRVRIVDDAGLELSTGRVGEIVSKPEDSLLTMSGYYGMPETSAEVLRDGWFHSGDLGRMDSEGNLFFEGRKKDAIRRRGENISAFEVEQVIESHESVLECAAYGVPSELTEEDVAVAVVRRPGYELDAKSLAAYCQGKMARYMVPVYITFHKTLPKTPTEKVSKKDLKAWHAKQAPRMINS